MHLKVFIDKNSNKVLYAEAGKDFVDFLLHTLMKPFGLAMKENFDDAILGCLTNLYTSVVKDLDVNYLQSGSTTQDAFDNPNLLKTFYTNRKCKSGCPNVVSDSKFQFCRKCNSFNEEAVLESNKKIEIGDGYVKGQVPYMVTDDLVVKPLSTSLSMSLLTQLGIKDIGCVQESQVSLDSAKQGLTRHCCLLAHGIGEGVLDFEDCFFNKSLLETSNPKV